MDPIIPFHSFTPGQDRKGNGQQTQIIPLSCPIGTKGMGVGYPLGSGVEQYQWD